MCPPLADSAVAEQVESKAFRGLLAGASGVTWFSVLDRAEDYYCEERCGVWSETGGAFLDRQPPTDRVRAGLHGELCPVWLGLGVEFMHPSLKYVCGFCREREKPNALARWKAVEGCWVAELVIDFLFDSPDLVGGDSGAE